MKSNYETPTVTMYFNLEEIVTMSGGFPESLTSFKETWLE